jgi:hypothetical protein
MNIVETKEIKTWWGFIKPGLEQILRKSPEDWIPEDVYAHCLNGSAVLWMFMDGDEPVGFWVLIPRGQTVHVWCAYTPYRVLDAGMKAFDDAMRKANVKQVTFDSNREGWNKVAEKYGFRPRSWVKELT